MEKFETSDGLSIAWREVGAPSDGVPVILQHGFAVDAEFNWVTPGIVDVLAGAGHRIVLIDARGHGASDKPHDSELYGEARMARDVSELADHLRLERFDLVGYSMGAIVALLCAARDARIRRLVVGGVGEGVVVCGGVDTRAVPNQAIVSALLAEEMDSIGPEARAFRAMADAAGADRMALAAQARVVHAAPIALDQILVPTLLLVGDRDPFAANPERLAEAILDSRLIRVKGDHLAAIADPEFASAIVEFLR